MRSSNSSVELLMLDLRDCVRVTGVDETLDLIRRDSVPVSFGLIVETKLDLLVSRTLPMMLSESLDVHLKLLDFVE